MARRPGEMLVFLRQAEAQPHLSAWALALDAVVAVAATAGALGEVINRSTDVISKPFGVIISQGPSHVALATLVAGALTALPLAVRRLYPITVMLVIVAATVYLRNNVIPPLAFGTAVFAAYSAVVHSRYRNIAIGTVLAVTLAVTAIFQNTLPQFPVRFTAFLAIMPAAAAGLGIRELRRRLTDSAARLRRAAAEHEAATRRAVEAERARIAAELHDVVTHNVSVMVVEAGAARMALASSPDEATHALLAVEASGRTAMAELRSLLGLLSPDGDGVAMRPQPGLGELDALIGRVSAAGLSVRLQVSGTPRPLPPGADLAAYRVVQEALTNVLRHAGRAAASVMVHWGEKLVITVSDDGYGAAATVPGGVSPQAGTMAPGRGLTGLRERLSLYGGELAAGPRAGGGWQVRAVMPAGLAI